MSSRIALLLSALLFSFQLSVPIFAAPINYVAPGWLEKRDISQTLYDDFVHYTKYTSAVREDSCPSPLGNKLVVQFEDKITDTQGFIARDDERKEIVVSFRGSEHPFDFFLDLLFILVPFQSSAFPTTFAASAARTKVHSGFLIAFNRVGSMVVSTVSKELAEHPGYTVVSTGHSLGGALASLAGVALKANLPDADLKVFTFGQPRTGNVAYADLVENVIGASNIFRAVHTTDFVTRIPPQEFGYQHHGTEYWIFADPASPSTVKQCTGREDPTCSLSRSSTIIDAGKPHGEYFGRVLSQDSDKLCMA